MYSLPTIVSCFFDLRQGVFENRSPNGDEIKKKQKYFNLAKDFILKLPYPLIFFTNDDDLISFIEIHRKEYLEKTCICKIAFEDLYFQKYSKEIQENKSFHKIRNECPIKDTIPYIILNYNKFDFLSKAIDINPFQSSHFLWLDFGINHIASNTEEIHKWILEIKDPIRQLCINPYFSFDQNHKSYFTYHYHNMAGGLFSGSIQNILQYKELFEKKIIQILSEKWYQNDEAIMTLVHYENPQLFDLYYGDYQGIVSNYQKPIHNINIIMDMIYKCNRFSKFDFLYHILQYLIPFYQIKENQTKYVSLYHLFIDNYIQVNSIFNDHIDIDFIYMINQGIYHKQKDIIQLIYKNEQIISSLKNKNLLIPLQRIEDLIPKYDISEIFKNIDKIILLNICKDKKIESLIQKLHDYQICTDKLIIIPYEENCTIVDYHITALEIAMKHHSKNIWILEDFFDFHLSKDLFYRHLYYFFQSKLPWDVFMMSLNISGPEHKVIPLYDFPFLQKIGYSQNATSYMVSTHYYQTLLHNMNESKEKLSINNQHWLYSHDVYWKSLQESGNWYSANIELIQRIS
jgi:hypothetical protein